MDSSTIVKTSSIVFYTTLAAFFIFLLMLVIHYSVTPFLPFISTNVKSIVSEEAYISKTLYNESPAPPDTLMKFDPTITILNKEKFTLTFDCMINNTYRSTTVPRVLLYFGGSSPAVVANNNSLREYFGSSESDTSRLLNSTNSDLITSFDKSNFIVYADPVKNDLKVGIFTSDENNKKYLEIASIIPNIPINEPFQITVVLGTTFVEVYKNKKLESTYTIGSLLQKSTRLNTSSIPASNYGIYTPISFIGDSIKIGNIQFYNGILTSGQIRDLTPTLRPKTFFR